MRLLPIVGRRRGRIIRDRASEAVHCSCATDSMNLNGVDVNYNDFVDRFATAGCAPF
jgi:hypothetical protein